MITAPQLLDEASGLLTQRGKQYDQEGGERSMKRAVEALNALTGAQLSESQGWLLMMLIKLVRDSKKAQCHPDSLVDLVAYASLYSESRHAATADLVFERSVNAFENALKAHASK